MFVEVTSRKQIAMRCKIFFWLVYANVALGNTLADDYFKCYRDRCRRGEQYCVEERQRCYICADIEHLCNTSRIPQQCDSYCVRVQLDTALAKKVNTTGQLTKTTEELQEEKANSVATATEIDLLNLKIRNLTEINEKLLGEVNSSRKNQPTYDESRQESEYYRNMLILAWTVSGVLLLVAIVLSMTSCCLLCPRRKRNQSLENQRQRGENSSFLPISPDHVPLIITRNNHVSQERTPSKSGACEITIHSDVKVAGLCVQNRNINHGEEEFVGDPPEYQPFVDKKTNNSDGKVMNVESGTGTDKIAPSGERSYPVYS